ncbi:sugar ABC transporter permease protein [Thermoclostridium stercorarium subsp. stercorarium DSM 8532]|uniref:Sugar ABC transporter permease protein n=2 Tax=Thermoclostridium stercorarium TaxID=1510 RepID=L7VRA0_THES1|nr:sugar ABC transporter permease [Thermoclostridium stercorarium]AGC69307.1 sugar ABC transporter permease protein [Thermoclostridium stercorarium subsp. stercorarium DSM 8532]AGI40270.1 ABC transporter permease subunit [Thermoclostridium stercorarium subsp. stercorarium DSM 8532]ANW99570.1 sugar ABC transporter permease [Thermoclostridium stercorarium subsp. thermolacticum DSM 2910]
MRKFYSNPVAIILFILPALTLFIIMILYPIIQVFVKSFYEWNGIGSGNFIGFKNYTMLFRDTVFYIANKNALIFSSVITVFQLVLGSFFAFALTNMKIAGKNFLRVAYFLPVVLSVTVVCQLWLSIYNADYGLLNNLFKALGLRYRQKWLSETSKAIYAVAFVNAWQWMGYQFALIMAGMKSIPDYYYEAAKIDGASQWKTYWHVTLPLLAETYKLSLIVSLTGGIKAFSEMFIMTKGGPGNATYTLTYIMYKAAFREYRYGYGMAAASIMVLECLLVIIIINRLVRQSEDFYKPRKNLNFKAG